MAELKELGTLVVVVGKARNLPNKSRFGKQDPFATVQVGEEKQRTKPIKRGGQHPEWDEELRFTIHEDIDDVLLRSESQSDFLSLNSSLSSKTLSGSALGSAGQPAPPPKDMGQLQLAGALTPAQLASKSRKGPLGKKGGKSMKVACYADDAKEPELIGEVVVPIDEVLKKGEVDEWYEFTYKDKYSGEVYLELTFYSNDAPPIKRNVPRPAVHHPSGGLYDSFPSSSSSSINGHGHSHSHAGGLSASGSVSGMSLYIPPYVQPSRISTPQPPVPISAPGLGHSSSFADLGVPPGHRHRQSLSTLPSQPSYPPSLMPGSSNALDALSRPFSSMSLNPAASSRPLPLSSPAPPHTGPQTHAYGNHRHSLNGPADAPWSSMLPGQQPKASSVPQPRPYSAQQGTAWDQSQGSDYQQRHGSTPITRPESSMTQSSSYSTYSQQQSYEPDAYRSTTPTPYAIPSSLQPHAPPHSQPRPHAHSFSGPSRPIIPPPTPMPHEQPQYLHPSQAPPPPPPLTHAATAPPAPQANMPGHYQIPTSSYSMLSQPVTAPQRAPSPQPGYQPPPQQSLSPHSSYNQYPPPGSGRPQSRNSSFPPAQQTYPSQPDPQGYTSTYAPDRTHTPMPNYPAQVSPGPPSSQAPPPASYSAHQAPGASSYDTSATTSQTGYVPWHQQTQPVAPAPAPLPPIQSYQDQYQHQQQQQPQSSYQSYSQTPEPSYHQVTSPPPVPSYRPAPQPPPPRQPRSSVGYYPSDELYVEQQRATTPQPPQMQPAPQSWQQQQQQQQYPQQSTANTPSPGMFSPPPQIQQQPDQTQAYQHQPYPPAASSPPRAPAGWTSTVGQYRSSSPIPPPPPPQHQNQNQNHSYQSSPVPNTYSQAPIPARMPSPAPSQVQQPYQQNGWSAPPSSSLHSQPPPIAQSSNTYQNQNQNQNQRSASPLPTQIGQDWKSYMKSLNAPAGGASASAPAHAHAQGGRSPSPQPQYNQNQGQDHGQGQGQGQGQNWYTPPPSLPTSIRPPDGWRSTLPTQGEGHQWR